MGANGLSAAAMSDLLLPDPVIRWLCAYGCGCYAPVANRFSPITPSCPALLITQCRRSPI